MPLPLKNRPVVGALAFLTVICWLLWPFPHKSSAGTSSRKDRSQQPLVYTPEEQELFSNLSRYGINHVDPGVKIHYAKLEFVVEPQPGHLPILQPIEAGLPPFAQLANTNELVSPVEKSYSLKVPITAVPPPLDHSNLIFGIATDLDRLVDALDAFAHWASHNGVRIVALVPEDAPERISDVQNQAAARGIDLTVMASPLEFNSRYFALVQTLYDHRTPATEWISLIDDDTFFPAIGNLQHVLSKYDARQPFYVGSLSEDFFQIGLWGVIAYGGAGVFLSIPLVTQLLPHLPECAKDDSTGDRRVSLCVLTYTITRMTHEPSLHQVDLRDDASGFYEALRPVPVSVHHWKSWNTINMPAVGRVSKVCGDVCVFQKYRFAATSSDRFGSSPSLPSPSPSPSPPGSAEPTPPGPDWQLTNGLSLMRYGYDRAATDIRMEKTWRDSRGDDQWEMFRHALAPMKPKDPAKVQYLLESAFHEPHDRLVRQFYVLREHERKTFSILEIVWRE